MVDNASRRFGSASVATTRDLKRAGMFKQNKRNSLFCGFWGKKPLWYSGAGGWLIVAGARSGKLRDLLAFSLCHSTCLQSRVILDMKGELSVISQNQTPDGKYRYHWNPLSLHGLPANRFNPLENFTRDNPLLAAIIKAFCLNFLPLSKGDNADFFDRRAQELLEGICLAEVQHTGYLTFPRLYEIVNMIPGNGDDWLEFAYLMSVSGIGLSKRIEEEIANSRSDHTGGFTGILGVLFKGFACLSDDKLLASVSPPYDFKLADIVSSERPCDFALIPPAEFIESWAPVIKTTFVCLYMLKAQHPQSPQMTMFFDEAAQLGSFPLLIKAFTYGAGIGIRPVAVFQSTKQMASLGENAENIITSSAQLRTYFGVRDLETATTLSNMIGAETLVYTDEAQQAQASLAKRQAVLSMINGSDPLNAALQYAHHDKEANRSRQVRRLKMEPNEILHMPADKMVFFTDGLPKPAYVDRKPYWDCLFMAGRYHPNPYHPPAHKVRVKTFWGHGWRKVITEPVPKRFTDYPQYHAQNGNSTWSRIAG